MKIPAAVDTIYRHDADTAAHLTLLSPSGHPLDQASSRCWALVVWRSRPFSAPSQADAFDPADQVPPHLAAPGPSSALLYQPNPPSGARTNQLPPPSRRSSSTPPPARHRERISLAHL
ncbi:hypothetical protein KC19_VG118100 [Ceratodon purpureus]|uniref:Uncharacterized protein n=1 Tax=Ceratodon purpureus TaxID=3225 RepID=A0A8T0HPH3_CERPU|nr:hypothetical protein KC19_VG118100 [Ceratodon purpureus]